MPGLGALHVEDARDQNYPLHLYHAALGVDTRPLPRSKSWRCGAQLNQGETPECAAYSTEGLMLASPIRQHWSTPDAIYQRAQAIDQIPMPHDGTTIRAVCEIGRQDGRIESYHWTDQYDDVRRQIAYVGPLLIGVPWLNSMFQIDSQGYYVVDPQSGIAGGHALLLHGYQGPDLHLRNSWGPGKWNGWLRWSDIEILRGVGWLELVAVKEAQG